MRRTQLAALDAQPHPAGGVTRILVVDDEQSVRKVIRRSLRAQGYEVCEAGDGPAALSLLASDAARPRLVITDAQMPGMSGHELAAVISRVYPGVRVILMSGAAQDAAPGAAVAHGQLQKPFKASNLLDAVRRALEPSPD
jgi:CheY-like chemotaxis protein